jgi:hypothetical protein
MLLYIKVSLVLLASWFKIFPSWLEYSLTNVVAHCLFCYLFSKKPSLGLLELTSFLEKGCSFLNHIGESPYSSRNNALKASQDLFDQSMHIQNVNVCSEFQSNQQKWLRLKSSIGSIYWLMLQACAIRGHGELLG